MRAKVSDARSLRDLILFLQECGCVAEQTSADEADVFLPSSRDEQAARMEVSVYLSAWSQRGETARAELLP